MLCKDSKKCKTRKHIGGHTFICDHNNLKVNCPDLIEEWDVKNGPMENYSFSSHKRVLWNCKNDPCGCHTWESTINHRTGESKRGCPFCCNKKVCKHSSLLHFYPELCKEWNYEKNKVSPDEISPGSDRKMWWTCFKNNCGCHEWETSVKSRTNLNDPTNCPFCSGQKVCKHSSLLNNYSILCDEWDYEKNTISPNEISCFSSRKIWWVCSKSHCGCHKWMSSVNNRTANKTGCPYCSNNKTCKHNSLLKLYPNLCEEWDYEKNELSPSEVPISSSRKFFWKCKKDPCGCHNWESNIANRTMLKSGCPFCCNHKICEHSSLLKVFPQVCEEWDYEKNTIHPNEVSPRSGKKAWWKCKKSEHSWRAIVNDRTRFDGTKFIGTRCPKCRLCPSCMLWITKGKLCEYCKPKPENKLYQKTKEMTVVKFLKDNLPEQDFIHNKSVGKDCTDGHLFPDIRFECFYYSEDNILNYNLIVEVDEFQHRGASYKCDKQRMYDIVAKISTPCIFIRFNPDGKESDTNVLLKYVKKCLKSPISKTGNFVWNKFGLKCIYLYYKS